MADRGATTTLSYVLSIGILTLLVSGLFVTAGGYVEDQRERAIRSELEVVGNRIAADIGAIDRLAIVDDGAGRARLRTNLPDRVGGRPYEITVTHPGDGPLTIDLTTTEPSVSVTVTVKNETAIETGTLPGDDLVFRYDGSRVEVDRG